MYTCPCPRSLHIVVFSSIKSPKLGEEKRQRTSRMRRNERGRGKKKKKKIKNRVFLFCPNSIHVGVVRGKRLSPVLWMRVGVADYRFNTLNTCSSSPLPLLLLLSLFLSFLLFHSIVHLLTPWIKQLTWPQQTLQGGECSHALLRGSSLEHSWSLDSQPCPCSHPTT